MIISKKQLIATVVPIIIVCVPVQADQSSSKTTGPTLLLQQDMMLFENDIFVARSKDVSNFAATQNRGLGLSSSFARWINGIVPYQFHSSISPGGMEVARQAIEHWNEKSSVTLVERDPEASNAPADFVEFVKGPGCASWVGRQGQAQEIWVSDFCTAGSMIHEVGHALGLLHEHTRADRDQHIEVIWNNIQQDKSFNFEINTSGSEDLGEYDFESIMHYGEYFFSSNGDRTMIPIDAPEDALIGQRKEASEGDLIAINTLYSTDLSLFTDLATDAESTDLNFRISNLSDTGAHAIVLNFDIGDAQNVFFNADLADENVACAVDGSLAKCRINILPGGSSTVVSVSLGAVLDEESVNPMLSSKTHDSNLANNGLNAAAAVGSEAIRSADSENVASSSMSGDAAGGGAGAMYDKGLLVLFLMLLLRLSKSALPLGANKSVRKQYAFTRIATSPRRTPR